MATTSRTGRRRGPRASISRRAPCSGRQLLVGGRTANQGERRRAQRCDQQTPQSRLNRLSPPLATSCHGCSRRATRWGSGAASPKGWSVSFGKSRRTTTSSARSFWPLPRGSRFRCATSSLCRGARSSLRSPAAMRRPSRRPLSSGAGAGERGTTKDRARHPR